LQRRPFFFFRTVPPVIEAPSLMKDPFFFFCSRPLLRENPLQFSPLPPQESVLLRNLASSYPPLNPIWWSRLFPSSSFSYKRFPPPPAGNFLCHPGSATARLSCHLSDEEGLATADLGVLVSFVSLFSLLNPSDATLKLLELRLPIPPFEGVSKAPLEMVDFLSCGTIPPELKIAFCPSTDFPLFRFALKFIPLAKAPLQNFGFCSPSGTKQQEIFFSFDTSFRSWRIFGDVPRSQTPIRNTPPRLV